MGYLYQWKGKLNQKMFSLSQKMILLSVPSHSGGSAYVFVCQRRITQDDICTAPSFCRLVEHIGPHFLKAGQPCFILGC